MISGKEFNERFKGKRFITFTDKDSLYDTFKIEEGLNVNSLEFDESTNPFGVGAGLYFCEYSKFGKWLHFNRWKLMYMWDVEILDYSNIKLMNRFNKCDSFVLTNQQSIWDTEELYLEAIKQDGCNLRGVTNQTDEICLMAIKQYGSALRYVKNKTNELCMEAIKQDGNALQFVEIQTRELCMEAVKQNGIALYWVKNKTFELCMEAVKQNGSALQYIKNQTDELCMVAVKQQYNVLRYVINQTDEICLEAVTHHGFDLQSVKNQTWEICSKAVEYDIAVASYVRNQEYKDKLTVDYVFKPYVGYKKRSECADSDIALWTDYDYNYI